MSTDQDFYKAAEELFRLYFEADYGKAFEIAEDLTRRFPDQEVTTYFWRVCLANRMGSQENALEIMREAVASGYWWSESQLRSDPDLETLQGNPEFEKLVEICFNRHADAQNASQPKLLVRTPAGEGPYSLLIALHGRGSSAEAAARHWEKAREHGWLVALPQSSQLAWPDAYAWDNHELAEREILTHYDALRLDNPLDRQRFVIAGFSQGAAMAIRLVVSGSIAAQGFIAVVPGAIEPELLAMMAEVGQRRGIKGYLVAGGKDHRYKAFLQIRDILANYGIPCEIEDHPDMAHEFPPDFELSLERALKYIAG